jgi:hypothetical protein
VQLPRFAIVPALALLIGLVACNDPNSIEINPLIVDDTVALAVPGVDASVGTALDIVSIPNTRKVGGARFPERAADAAQWDFALRREDGELVLVPSGTFGFASGSGITRPITDRTFDQVTEAPSSRSAVVTDSAVVLRSGAVYVARSRQIPCGFGGASQYARIEAVALDPAAGTARLRVATNEVCNDIRLTPKE